ncbi:hypothetical protein [Streptomyces sp. bgisy060]|uniref:hypothetical protein n=1 Tax=Streptomyces sp. bgisy060 TaxID=3413775 RepID=UPI003EB942F6
MPDVQGGGTEGEHLAEAGEVLPWVVAEGRVGWFAGDETHEGIGDEVTGDEVTGDEVTGDEVTGDEVTGDEVTGDEVPVPRSPGAELSGAGSGTARYGRTDQSDGVSPVQAKRRAQRSVVSFGSPPGPDDGAVLSGARLFAPVLAGTNGAVTFPLIMDGCPCMLVNCP